MVEMIMENSRNEAFEELYEKYFPDTSNLLRDLNFLDPYEGKMVDMDELMREFCMQQAERIWIGMEEGEEFVNSDVRKLIHTLFNDGIELYKKGKRVEQDIPFEVSKPILNALEQEKCIRLIIEGRMDEGKGISYKYKATIDRARRELTKKIEKELKRLYECTIEKSRFYCGEVLSDENCGMVLPCKGCLGFTSNQLYLELDDYKCPDGKNIGAELPKIIYDQIRNARQYLISELKRKLEVLKE